MKVYGSNAIRNVAFVGHGASGKTSLVDALACVSGSSRRHGSIKDGTTLTDYSPDEIERKHSISLGPRLRRVARYQDQPDRHPRLPRLLRRGRDRRCTRPTPRWSC